MVPVDPNTPVLPGGQEQQIPTPAAAFDPSPYLPDDPNAPSQPGVVQGQPANAQPVFDPAKHFQSIADQRLADNLRLQQENERLKSQVPQGAQAIQANPYNPQTEWPAWIKFENLAAARQASQETAQAVRQEFQGMFQQATEAQWVQAHPNVDINAVKAFMQVRRVGNMDDAYTLMTLPNQLAQAQSQASQQAINQFRQPNLGATPIRGAQNMGSPIQAQLSYAKLAAAYVADPRVADTWPQEVKDAFDRETNLRGQAG